MKISHINKQEALIYLGYRGMNLPADIDADIERCSEIIMKEIVPRTIWKRFDLLEDGTVAGTSVHFAGSDIWKLLNGCKSVILMAATLGSEVESLVRRYQVKSPADAVILDACASAAIESVCDDLCNQIAVEIRPLYLTDRFSPGYGDMPLSQQTEIFQLLDITKRIGVSLTDSWLMVPQKSVTAIIGLSHAPVKMRPRGCAVCSMFETCRYRKDGVNCGSNHS